MQSIAICNDPVQISRPNWQKGFTDPPFNNRLKFEFVIKSGYGGIPIRVGFVRFGMVVFMGDVWYWIWDVF